MNQQLDLKYIDKKRIQELVDNYWLGLGDVSKYNIRHPLIEPQDGFFKDNPELLYLDYFSDPNYFESTCRLFFNVQVHPFQAAILKELWKRPFPILLGSRGMSKTFSLALYALLRAFLTQGSRVIIAGSGFRQSRMVFDYCLKIWNNAPLLRNCCEAFGGRQGPFSSTDRVGFYVGESKISGLPIGTGQSIRGERASHLILDEFASHNPEIYETVLSGFAAVSQNPIDNIVAEAKREALIELGLWTKQMEDEFSERSVNQTILSGTASYQFNHFYEYWNRYRNIIYSRGDVDKLAEKGIELPEGVSWKDFSIIRIPYKMLPKGYLDQKTVAKGKATMHKSAFLMEFEACHSIDSEGFFKRSLIESCVTKAPIILSSGPVKFNPVIKGNKGFEYVIAVDPASEMDNFALIVMELHPDHRRVVYVWTINRRLHMERLKADSSLDGDFYGYCARKIRNLMKMFRVKQIGMDAQGGGRAVAEALHDKDKIEPMERLIWPIVDQNKSQDTDYFEGLHMLEMVEFSNAKWVADANHNLKKDLEDKTILFPYFDELSETLAMEDDKRVGRPDYDNMENLISEIEELKNELSIITHSMTPTGREKWDTPGGIMTGGKNKHQRQRKDRYTALLIANAVARKLQAPEMIIEYKAEGGFAGSVDKNGTGPMFVGPDWYIQGMKGVYE